MKKSMDLLNSKYAKREGNHHYIETDINDFNYNNTSNKELYSSISNINNLQSENAIKEPPAQIQRKKKIIMKTIDKSNEKPYSSNGPKNTWVKKIKKNIDFNRKGKQKINKALIENEDDIVEQSEEINEIKESVMCYICLSKVVQPKMCPNCQKIACKECLKNWFIKKGNKNCGYCRSEINFDKMISVPILDSVANLIEKISVKNSQILQNYPQIKNSAILNKRMIQDDNNINNNNRISFSDLGNIYKSGKKYKKGENNENSDNEMNEVDYCQKHSDQPLYYFCVDCNKSYCRTCFVFFGEEKDKHNNHTIIEYKKYKLNNISQFIKEKENLEDKSIELNSLIKRCESLKECYETERELVLNYTKKIIDNYTIEVDNNIKVLDSIINTYQNYLEQIEKCIKDIQKIYTNSKINKEYEELLMKKINNINEIKYYNSKEIDTYSDISKSVDIKVYQTKLKKFEIKQKSFHYKIPLMKTNKYNLSIIQKGNEVQIYIYWPDDINAENKFNLLPFIFMRKKNKNWEFFKLNEFLNYNGNNYYIKRFNSSNFCNINSYFKIKAILYENIAD